MLDPPPEIRKGLPDQALHLGDASASARPSRPPGTRAYANLDAVLAGIGTHAGRGTITSGTAERGEGTTFELSWYTDPLGIEHLTGSLAITHRFSPASKDVLLDWYPRTKLEMDEGGRSAKRSKSGGVKYVYPRETQTELRSWFAGELERTLPGVPLLYWT